MPLNRTLTPEEAAEQLWFYVLVLVYFMGMAARECWFNHRHRPPPASRPTVSSSREGGAGEGLKPSQTQMTDLVIRN
jgi:hypothetical protein